MNRRDTVAALLALGAAPHTIRAQHAEKIPRLCFLTYDPGSSRASRYNPFFKGLRDLGYIDGRNIIIDYLSADGRSERFPAIAAECLRLKADVVVATTTPATQAALRATHTVPIVMMGLGDPVGSGLIDSLARPGGNVTGLTNITPALAAKRLELLKELVPRISRVLVLTYPLDPISALQIERMKNAARQMGVSLVIREIRAVDDLPAAFEAGVKERAEGLIPTSVSIFAVNYLPVIELAARHKLPAVYPFATYVPHGGLMTYSVDFPDIYANAASYVDKILKGAKPADLPVQQATRFELVVNRKTAKTLGLTIPQSILVRADRVIE